MTKSNSEKKGFLSAYNFQHTTKSLREVTAVTQGRTLEAGIEEVAMGEAASCLLLLAVSLFCIYPRTTCSGAASLSMGWAFYINH